MISILDILKDLLAHILEDLHLLLLIVVITIILHILVQDPRLQDIIQVQGLLHQAKDILPTILIQEQDQRDTQDHLQEAQVDQEDQEVHHL